MSKVYEFDGFDVVVKSNDVGIPEIHKVGGFDCVVFDADNGFCMPASDFMNSYFKQKIERYRLLELCKLIDDKLEESGGKPVPLAPIVSVHNRVDWRGMSENVFPGTTSIYCSLLDQCFFGRYKTSKLGSNKHSRVVIEKVR